MNAWRCIVSAIFLLLVLFAQGKVGALGTVPAAAFVALCASLVFSFVLGDTLFFQSMSLVGVPTALPLSMTYPLYVLVIAFFLLGERITFWTIGGTALVIAGTFSVASAAQALPHRTARDRTLGVMLGLASAWCFAISTSILKIGVQEIDVGVAGAIRLGLTAILLLLWRASVMRVEPFRAYGARMLLILTVAGLLGTGIGTMLYLTAVQQAGAALAATLATTAPLFATPLSALLLHERLTWHNVLGMVLCVVGVWLVIPR